MYKWICKLTLKISVVGCWCVGLFLFSAFSSASMADSQNELACVPKSIDEVFSLDNVLAAVGCHSYIVRGAWFKVLQNEEQSNELATLYWPNVNFSGASTYASTRGHEQRFSTSAKRNSNNVAMEATWTLYDFGYRDALMEQSKVLAEIALLEYKASVYDVSKNAAYTYVRILELQELTLILTDSERFLSDILDLAQERYAVGVSNLAEQLTVTAALDEARIAKLQATREQSSQCSLMNSLMGRPLEAECRFEKLDPNALHYSSIERAKMIESSGRSHLTVLLAGSMLRAKQAEIDQAKAPTGAEINLYATRVLDDFDNGRKHATEIGLKFTYPLSEEFGRKSRLKTKRYIASAAEANLYEARRKATQSAWEKSDLIRSNEDALRLAKQLLQSSQFVFESEKRRYQSGISTSALLLDTYRGLLSAKQQVSRFSLALYLTRLDFLEAVGGFDNLSFRVFDFGFLEEGVGMG